MIFILISISVFTAYILLIGAISIGWWKLKVFEENRSIPETKVSVIIAVRNETFNIKALINNLLQQDYNPGFFEIIIVDDHSSDDTSHLVDAFISQSKGAISLKLIKLGENDGYGKKTALSTGIQASSGELILITDADCVAGTKWISRMASFYETHKPRMILGPVRMTDGDSVFGKLQAMEFVSLISSAAGSCNAGFPIMANGANMAFTRDAYESCGGFNGNFQFPSGDDMFLMMSIKKKFGAKSIRFLRSEVAIISTPATQGLKAFIQQRMRWVSKSKGYTDPLLIASSIIVFLTNAWLIFTVFAAIYSTWFLTVFLVLYIIKFLVDFPLMYSYSRFQRSGFLLWLFPLMELLNAAYTICIGIAGNIGKYEWKGRRLSGNPQE